MTQFASMVAVLKFKVCLVTCRLVMVNIIININNNDYIIYILLIIILNINDYVMVAIK